MESQFTQIKQFLNEVYKRRRLFITVAAATAMMAVGASFFVPKRYEASSTVFIERNIINSLMKGLTVSPSLDERIRVLHYYMVSRDMVVRTLKKMDMDVDQRYSTRTNFEMLVRKCQRETKINIKGQDLFIVSMTDQDPYFAQNYINNLVNIYVEENLSVKREESYGANRFLTEQVTFYKQKLDEIEAKINDFRKQTGIYSTVNEPGLMAQIAKDEDSLKEIKGQQTQALATIKTIQKQLEMLSRSSGRGQGDSIIGENSVSSTDYQIAQLQAKINELLLVYNDQYPTVVKLRDQIEELKKRHDGGGSAPNLNVESDNNNLIMDPIYVDLKMRLNTAQSDLNALSAKEDDLRKSILSNQALLRNFPEDKKTLNDLERERSMQASIYEQLLQRVGVSEVSKQMEISDKSATFRIVDPAVLPITPIGTKRIVLMMLGIVAGLAAGLGAVYIAVLFDTSLRNSQSLRDLGVTVLAEIPFIWSVEDQQLMRRKDKAVLVFAVVCGLVIATMLLHDLLGLKLVDHAIESFRIKV
jgi:succinoglycan biosynthesis transport protein ExoP